MDRSEELTRILFYRIFLDSLPARFKKMKWKERKKCLAKKKEQFIKEMEN